MKFSILGALVAIALLFGCATIDSGLTGDQLYELTHRDYSGVTKEQVLSAVEELFRLADGDDFNITKTDNDLIATRYWQKIHPIYPQGTDYWKIDVIEDGDAAMVAANLYTAAGTITDFGTNLTLSTNLIKTTALYDVFWARLEYLLGNRDDWMDCEKANERVDQGITSGSNEALCHPYNLDNDAPS